MRLRFRTTFTAMILVAILITYGSIYYRLSRRGIDEAKSYGLAGFLYVPAKEVFASKDLSVHHRSALAFSQQIGSIATFSADLRLSLASCLFRQSLYKCGRILSSIKRLEAFPIQVRPWTANGSEHIPSESPRNRRRLIDFRTLIQTPNMRPYSNEPPNSIPIRAIVLNFVHSEHLPTRMEIGYQLKFRRPRWTCLTQSQKKRSRNREHDQIASVRIHIGRLRRAVS